MASHCSCCYRSLHCVASISHKAHQQLSINGSFQCFAGRYRTCSFALPTVLVIVLFCSSFRMETLRSLPSTPSEPLIKMEMGPSTSESSFVHCPSPHGAVLSKSLTGPSTCMTWMVMVKLQEWKCWKS